MEAVEGTLNIVKSKKNTLLTQRDKLVTAIYERKEFPSPLPLLLLLSIPIFFLPPPFSSSSLFLTSLLSSSCFWYSSTPLPPPAPPPARIDFIVCLLIVQVKRINSIGKYDTKKSKTNGFLDDYMSRLTTLPSFLQLRKLNGKIRCYLSRER